MGFFKPTWKKVIISFSLALLPWLIPYFYARLTPNGEGAYIFFLFLPLLPTMYLSDDLVTKLNLTSLFLIDMFVDFLLFYFIVCTIAYFAGKWKQQKQ